MTTGDVGCSRRPRIQSFVRQPSQTFRSRAFTSSGETVEATKLNWPSGQTNLQNEACLKKESTRSAPAKYATTSHAVQKGEPHRSNSSYANSTPTKSASESHLLRKARGQLR